MLSFLLHLPPNPQPLAAQAAPTSIRWSRIYGTSSPSLVLLNYVRRYVGSYTGTYKHAHPPALSSYCAPYLVGASNDQDPCRVALDLPNPWPD
jgi:hypothetical protein